MFTILKASTSVRMDFQQSYQFNLSKRHFWPSHESEYKLELRRGCGGDPKQQPGYPNIGPRITREASVHIRDLIWPSAILPCGDPYVENGFNNHLPYIFLVRPEDREYGSNGDLKARFPDPAGPGDFNLQDGRRLSVAISAAALSGRTVAEGS
jgi:hypothetical protein